MRHEHANAEPQTDDDPRAQKDRGEIIVFLKQKLYERVENTSTGAQVSRYNVLWVCCICCVSTRIEME